MRFVIVRSITLFIITIHAPIRYRYGSTFLHYCGLIGSHVVPIVHSVLSGLDNDLLFNVKGPEF